MLKCFARWRYGHTFVVPRRIPKLVLKSVLINSFHFLKERFVLLSPEYPLVHYFLFVRAKE